MGVLALVVSSFFFVICLAVDFEFSFLDGLNS